MKKKDWISVFRDFSAKALKSYKDDGLDKNDLTYLMNRDIKNFADKKICELNQNEGTKLVLNEVLTITYASYVVMLETRNQIWPYDFMSFSRRIGELWEPFCKLAFEYPVKQLKLVDPPEFKDFKNSEEIKMMKYIDSLKINETQKKVLKEMYSIPWNLVDSGSIKMALDLHFSQGGIRFNCDFKSGFSSNEKGNTNRLLLVASIYKLLQTKEKTLLFVRQKESENNHYLQTLKNSGLWDVYCSDECYRKLREFTGADLRAWLDKNALWEDDITSAFYSHLKGNDLLKYLTW